MGIRFLKKEDCDQVLEIYAPYILETAISFETEVPSLEEFQDRCLAVASQYPWLVYEEDGKILGYAYGSSHRSRCAYSWSCEVSVYIDQDHHKKGLGKKLYEALFPILKEQGYYNLFAGVTQPNVPSDKIHTRLGFEKIGTYKNIGYKFSEWRDVTWYQLELNSGGVPKAPVSVSRLKLPESLFS